MSNSPFRVRVGVVYGDRYPLVHGIRHCVFGRKTVVIREDVNEGRLSENP